MAIQLLRSGILSDNQCCQALINTYNFPGCEKRYTFFCMQSRDLIRTVCMY